jgi:hypothetical protein
MEEAAGLVGASDARAMALVAQEGLQEQQMPQPGLTAPARRRAASSGSSSAQSEVSSEDSDTSGPARPVTNRQPHCEANSVAALLSQLRQEPEDASECAAKFSLYEGYASEVENMRNALFNFHEESRPSLPPAILTDMDRQIKGVDNVECMQIPDRSREWFVYHMMRQAEKNNLKMAGILDGFDKKLKFLAQNDQADCPICLEPFQEGDAKAAETLGCCHKVCRECWQNWSKIMRGRPFCPFCRHEDFLGAVAARASAPIDSDSGSDSDVN